MGQRPTPTADVRGRVAVQFGEQSKFLHFTANAVVQLEEQLGSSIMGLFTGDESVRAERLGITQIRALLWAGVRGAGSKFSIDDIGEMMDLADLGYYTQCVVTALSAKFQPSKPEDAEDESLRPTVEAVAPPSP